MEKVVFSRLVEKQLRKLPKNIRDGLMLWVASVAYRGLREIRKISGYHDEPLFGRRFGQRSIRLNNAYRAIYRVEKSGEITLIVVEEVNKHDY